jgi:hypothetical protein
MEVETHSERVARELSEAESSGRVVPGRTLPKGRQWVGHDSPGRGTAPARRLRQIARQNEKMGTDG